MLHEDPKTARRWAKAYFATDEGKALRRQGMLRYRSAAAIDAEEEAKAARKARGKALARQREYGLDPERYDAMLAERGPNCPTCNRVAPPVVDHCHETGFVRGLLCTKCNSALGMAKDNPATLRALAAYIEQAAVARLFS